MNDNFVEFCSNDEPADPQEYFAWMWLLDPSSANDFYSECEPELQDLIDACSSSQQLVTQFSTVGMAHFCIVGNTLADYCELVDTTGRSMCTDIKGYIDDSLSPILKFSFIGAVLFTIIRVKVRLKTILN